MRRFAQLVMALGTGVLLPFFAFAADSAAPPSRDIPLQIGILSHTTVTGLSQYIGLLYQYLTGIAGVMAVSMIMYGGMRWIFAGGDKGKIGAAKEVITHAVIGLILALAAFLILNTINPALVNLKLPTVQNITALRLVHDWCKDENNTPGSYQCGQLYHLTDKDGAIGDCRGAACPNGGGCYHTKTEYKCIDPASCPTSCDDINSFSDVHSDNDLRVYCASGVCKAAIPGGCRVFEGSSFNTYHPTTQCVDAAHEGDHCETNEDCGHASSGLVCVTARGYNTCEQTPTDNLPNWTDCDLGLTHACGPTATCIDTTGPDGQCSDGTAGAACDKQADCQGGLLCHACRGIENNKCGPAGDVTTCFRYSLSCDAQKRNTGTCYTNGG